MVPDDVAQLQEDVESLCREMGAKAVGVADLGRLKEGQPDLLDAVFTAQVPMSDGSGFGYGYGWVIGEQLGRPVAKHSGGIEGYSAHIARYPDDDAVVIVLSNQQRTNPQAVATELAQILFGDE